MYRYKDRMSPQQRRANPSYQRLLILLAGFVSVHAACLDTVAALPVTTVATVPSLSGRTGVHPLADLATVFPEHWKRVDLRSAQVPPAERRATKSDHFGVFDSREIAGRHVIVLDDTWVQGGHAQSAAATLLCAGAVEVTAIVLARRIDPSFRADVMQPSLDRMFAPSEYSLEVCPITGGACPE